MNELEKKFGLEMENIYCTAKRELNYNATRFLQLVASEGGLKAAKKLIAKNEGTYGFEILWENNRLDLSVEALVLKPQYEELFSDEERKQCRDRLENFGFKIYD